MIHICYQVKKKCWNFYDSYGEICVGCGCCSPNQLERAKARLALCERQLKEQYEFDGWFEDLKELQEKNIKANIRYFKRQIRYYKKRVDMLTLMKKLNE